MIDLAVHNYRHEYLNERDQPGNLHSLFLGLIREPPHIWAMLDYYELSLQHPDIIDKIHDTYPKALPYDSIPSLDDLAIVQLPLRVEQEVVHL